VLVTGASGLVAFPVAAELVQSNEVHASLAGRIPAEANDRVGNYAVLPPSHKDAYEVDTDATGDASAIARPSSTAAPARSRMNCVQRC